MSETTEQNVTMTQKEFVMAQREAFASGVRWLFAQGSAPHGLGKYVDEPITRCAAQSLFSLKVKRPRVVADPHSGFTQRWRVRDGVIEWESSWDGKGDTWEQLVAEYGFSTGHPGGINVVTPRRIRVWADLLDNPTEESEAE